MWSFRDEELDGGRGLRFAITFDAQPASFADVFRGWRENAAFRSHFNECLARSPFPAFRWETPPVTATTLARRFEFVLLESPGLARLPDVDAFAEHFDNAAGADVIVFPNLGGDAILVVPCPIAGPSAYGHLAAFVRHAPERQRHAYWRLVGEAMLQRVDLRPVWLSTAGAGVSWLHVRLDNRPKYYAFGPYRQAEPPLSSKRR